MGIPSAAEAKLDARIRPDITVLRSVTPYPRRHRPALTVLDGGIDHGQVAGLAGDETSNPARTEAANAMKPALVTRSRAVPAATAAGPVRLTRRGKIVVWVLAAVTIASAAVLIWLAVAGRAQAAQEVGPGATGSQGMLRVVVHPGQTLWSIAVQADPRADPRLVIQQIIDDNALRGTALQVGQVLSVPRL
jgi:nucleoid-associated protein YgaU